MTIEERKVSDTKSAGEPYRVLFLCTGNSARSSMAEAILNRIGPPRFRAFSAGSHPKGKVHPQALRLLDALGHDTSGLRSKSWDEFTHGTAFDHIITVCGKAAGEPCPTLPGRPAKLHWDIPDPTSASGTPPQIEAAFRQAYDMLLERIGAFVNR
jgi:protein-tyrosine-phosphatase